MKQLELLMRILKTPGIFSTEVQRAQAKAQLDEKRKRRDRKVMHQTQLKIDGNGRF